MNASPLDANQTANTGYVINIPLVGGKTATIQMGKEWGNMSKKEQDSFMQRIADQYKEDYSDMGSLINENTTDTFDVTADAASYVPGGWAGFKAGWKAAPSGPRVLGLPTGKIAGGIVGGGLASDVTAPYVRPMVDPLRPYAEPVLDAMNEDTVDGLLNEAEHMQATGATRGSHISNLSEGMLAQLAAGKEPYEGYGSVNPQESAEALQILQTRQRINPKAPLAGLDGGVTAEQHNAIEASKQAIADKYSGYDANIRPGETPPAP